MSFYTLPELNIKLIDFIYLLSPLGAVKKIVSNGIHHLVEIQLHNPIISDNLDDNEIIKVDNINQNIEFTENCPLRLYRDKKLGFIINKNICIIEIPKGISTDHKYLSKLNEKDKKSISKYIKKNIPKDCQKISKLKILFEKNIATDPESINIINFKGYRQISV